VGLAGRDVDEFAGDGRGGRFGEVLVAGQGRGGAQLVVGDDGQDQSDGVGVELVGWHVRHGGGFQVKVGVVDDGVVAVDGVDLGGRWWSASRVVRTGWWRHKANSSP
jgi:hypothetical protein